MIEEAGELPRALPFRLSTGPWAKELDVADVIRVCPLETLKILDQFGLNADAISHLFPPRPELAILDHSGSG